MGAFSMADWWSLLAWLLIDKVDSRTASFAVSIWNNLRVHVVLKRQDDGEGRGLEGTLRYGLDHLLETQEEQESRLELQPAVD